MMDGNQRQWMPPLHSSLKQLHTQTDALAMLLLTLGVVLAATSALADLDFRNAAAYPPDTTWLPLAMEDEEDDRVVVVEAESEVDEGLGPVSIPPSTTTSILGELSGDSAGNDATDRSGLGCRGAAFLLLFPALVFEAFAEFWLPL